MRGEYGIGCRVRWYMLNKERNKGGNATLLDYLLLLSDAKLLQSGT